MKLNHDLVRLLLSAVEASPEPVNLSSLDFEGFTRLEIDSHCEELFDRGYIKGEVNKYIGSTDYIAFCLTPEGSAFLESLTTKKLRFLKKLINPILHFVRDVLVQHFANKF